MPQRISRRPLPRFPPRRSATAAGWGRAPALAALVLMAPSLPAPASSAPASSAPASAQSFDQTAPVAPSSVPVTPEQGAQDRAAIVGNDPKAPLPVRPPEPPPPRFQDRTAPPP